MRRREVDATQRHQAGDPDGGRAEGMTIMAIATRVFDAAAYLDDEEAIAEYLTAALETGDASSSLTRSASWRAPRE
jgi:hypothetical protein